MCVWGGGGDEVWEKREKEREKRFVERATRRRTKKKEKTKTFLPPSRSLSPRRRSLRLPHYVPFVDGDEPVGGRLLLPRRIRRRGRRTSPLPLPPPPVTARRVLLRGAADAADGPERLERRRRDAARGHLAAGEGAMVLGDAAAPRGGVGVGGGGRGGGGRGCCGSGDSGGGGARRNAPRSPGKKRCRRLRPPRGTHPREPHRALSRAAQHGRANRSAAPGDGPQRRPAGGLWRARRLAQPPREAGFVKLGRAEAGEPGLLCDPGDEGHDGPGEARDAALVFCGWWWVCV